ncbi:MAG: phosphatase PAP2 family protein [Armatimonadota bacterium]
MQDEASHRRRHPITLTITGAWKALWRWLTAHPALAIAFVLAGMAVWMFAGIADELRENDLGPVDSYLVGLLIPLRLSPLNGLLEALSRGLSALLVWPYLLLLLVPPIIFLVAIKRNFTALMLMLLPYGTYVLVEFFKYLFKRPRPISALIVEIGQSFPSGHATVSVVVYGLLAYALWRFVVHARWGRIFVTTIAVLFILGTGFTRVYLQVHYPTDVLAGWAAGLFILIGAIIALNRWQPQ